MLGVVRLPRVFHCPPAPHIPFCPSSPRQPCRRLFLSVFEALVHFAHVSRSSVSQQGATSATTTTFLTALVFNGAVFAAEIIAFTLLRPYFKPIYEPRTVHLIENQRVKSFDGGLFSWPIALFKADYRDIERVNGPDAYLFVRFLRMMIRVLLPIWIISWAVLLPLTSVNNSVAGKTGLDRFTFGNVSPYNQPRYAGHLVCAYLFTFWIYWNIRREMSHFVTVRQLYLVDSKHSRSSQANTILVTGIPAKFQSEQALAQLYSHLPGGVKKVWLNRNLKDLPAVYNRRLSACNKLESAETNLIRTALKIRNKKLKGGEKVDDAYNDNPDQAERDIALAEKLVPKDKRPTHRLPPSFLPFSLPFVGEKLVMLSQNNRTRLQQMIDGNGGTSHEDLPVQTYPPLSSAFITFKKQIAAHMAHRMLTHHDPYRMADRYLEVSPQDVIWGNLAMNPYEKRVRKVISYAATAALIIFWAIPVAFVGIVSNIQGLCVRESWLAWLCKIPSPVIGIIQGILPAVLLAVLNMLLPIVLRMLGSFEGIPTRTGLELSLMTRFFIFQVIHSFLIVTLSSGIIAALPSILKNPSSIATLLASYLPQASTFFLTYIVLQGLSGVAGSFLSIVQLVLYYVKLVLLGSTPRSIYNIKFGPRTVAWGTLFPSITLLTVVTFGYSIISPIINGLSVAAFFLFYLLYKYLFLYQYTQPPQLDTGGLFFPRAIQHVFVGLYVQQVCLCALFFLAQNASGKQAAVPEGALMVVLILLTCGFLAVNYRRQDSRPILTEPVSGDAHASTSADASNGKQWKATKGDAVPDPDREGEEQELDDYYFQKLADGAPDYGFAHPAVSRPQRVVWIPDDSDAWANAGDDGAAEVEGGGRRRGLGPAEVEVNSSQGISATTEGTKMDSKGHLEVFEAPVDVE
ncbi:hypothetical protein F5141DRAFT_1290632 [Pisolithus sp. B1]|nr:hypothetical protein F5141DRAFT_1290632 [Pisolithus sp. B1]